MTPRYIERSGYTGGLAEEEVFKPLTLPKLSHDDFLMLERSVGLRQIVTSRDGEDTHHRKREVVSDRAHIQDLLAKAEKQFGSAVHHYVKIEPKRSGNGHWVLRRIGEYECYKLCMNHQNERFDPSDPPPERGLNDLQYYVAQELELENFGELQIYSALHSSLDYGRGTDGFVHIEYKGRPIYIPLDISKKEKHPNSRKVLLVAEYMYPGAENEQYIQEKAYEIADMIKEKMAEIDEAEEDIERRRKDTRDRWNQAQG